MGKRIERLKNKYGITTTTNLILIFSTYSLAGTGVGFTVRQIMHGVFHPYQKIPHLLYILIYITFALPTYQALLLILGFILGQGKFFWGRFGKLRAALGRFFKARGETLVSLLVPRKS